MLAFVCRTIRSPGSLFPVGVCGPVPFSWQRSPYGGGRKKEGDSILRLTHRPVLDTCLRCCIFRFLPFRGALPGPPGVLCTAAMSTISANGTPPEGDERRLSAKWDIRRFRSLGLLV